GVDQRRDAVRSADRDDGEDVVEMAVGQQDGRSLQAVFADHRVDGVFYSHTRVDDDAFLARRGGDDEAVRLESSGDDSTDQHVIEATGSGSDTRPTVRARTPFRDSLPPCRPPAANSNSPAPEPNAST